MACKVGDWVQIHTVVLPAGSRAPQVPAETQKVPLEMWCKGFACQEGEIGDAITIKTVIGEEITGNLTAINPRPGHDFGGPIPELLDVGVKLRKRIKGADSLD